MESYNIKVRREDDGPDFTVYSSLRNLYNKENPDYYQVQVTFSSGTVGITLPEAPSSDQLQKLTSIIEENQNKFLQEISDSLSKVLSF